jgi:hypothetical protein
MKYILALLIVMFSSQCAFASVGTIVEQTGPTAIERNKTNIESTKGTGIEMADTVKTARARVGIQFEDNSTVQITEDSKLEIDEFVYDPQNNVGKVAIKVALGTVRMASGNIAHNNSDNVDIQTPTATIAVRGTDFSMSVDEIGRSVIVLLPSCPPYIHDESLCKVGEISVITNGGIVTLNKAYQATVVNSRNSPPSTPKVISINLENINNMILIAIPKEIKKQYSSDTQLKIDQVNVDFLNQDFLQFDDLKVNQLADNSLADSTAQTKLDINLLNVSFLFDILAVDSNSIGLAYNPLAEAVNTVLPNFKPIAGLSAVVTPYDVTITRQASDQLAQINVQRYTNATLTITQDNLKTVTTVNSGQAVAFNIKQGP